MTKSSQQQNQRSLLVTMTKEPFQPVRLYYRIPSRLAVLAKLRGLECTVEDPIERCWQWLYHGETKSLRFATAGYEDVPKERQPIILGRIRFPKSGGMTLQTNSIERAVQAAKFFAPHLGSRVVAARCRVVNRCFAAAEGAPDELMKNLDRNVTVIDPRDAEAEMEEDFKGIRSPEDAERAAAKSMEEKLKAGKDVPLVEDFSLAPEEETPDFQHLAMTLNLRFVRAFEHWRGNRHLTLTAIIMRTVEEQMRAQGEFPR
ncbi:MAG: hypothetical protein OEZ06_11685 [Myxococcales bacterium]|nr:hypothetical protein [Myxococcales bacterium]